MIKPETPPAFTPGDSVSWTTGATRRVGNVIKTDRLDTLVACGSLRWRGPTSALAGVAETK
jgi:hypothetical protein